MSHESYDPVGLLTKQTRTLCTFKFLVEEAQTFISTDATVFS